MFDPIHNGHIRLAENARRRCGLDEIRFIPCHIPTHRPPPVAAARHRCAMIRAALDGREGLVLDDREIRKPSPSYTIDTLRELRAELGPDRSLYLLLGGDSCAGLPAWKEWREIPKLAHIVVVPRKAPSAPSSKTEEPPVLAAANIAVIVVDDDVPPYSSNRIRAALKRGDSISDAVPAAVSDYIARHRLYE